MSLSGKGLRKSLEHGSPPIPDQEPQRKPNCGYLCATPLRDALLPKLVSGGIRVTEIEKSVEALR